MRNSLTSSQTFTLLITKLVPFWFQYCLEICIVKKKYSRLMSLRVSDSIFGTDHRYRSRIFSYEYLHLYSNVYSSFFVYFLCIILFFLDGGKFLIFGSVSRLTIWLQDPRVCKILTIWVKAELWNYFRCWRRINFVVLLFTMMVSCSSLISSFNKLEDSVRKNKLF